MHDFYELSWVQRGHSTQLSEYHGYTVGPYLSYRRTDTDRHILSTNCLTVFEDLLNMMVLPSFQVLHQSSTGTTSRDVVTVINGVWTVVRIFFISGGDHRNKTNEENTKLWDSSIGWNHSDQKMVVFY